MNESAWTLRRLPCWLPVCLAFRPMRRAKCPHAKSSCAPLRHHHSCGRSHCCRVVVRCRDRFGCAPKLCQRTILGSDHQHLSEPTSGGQLCARRVLERLVQCLPTPGSTLVRFTSLGREECHGILYGALPGGCALLRCTPTVLICLPHSPTTASSGGKFRPPRRSGRSAQRERGTREPECCLP